MNTTNKTSILFLITTLLICLLAVATDVNAAINNDGIMDQVLNRFESNASAWASIIESATTRLFWSLVLISMVITFGFMALRKADIGEFFAEFARFTIFTGFFWWLLINGPVFAKSIINSLRQLGGSAAGLGGYSGQFSPSEIVDIGFIMLGKTLVESSVWSPVDSLLGIILGLIVLGLTAMIAVNVLLLYVSAWILAYGGIFFLGFGGSSWTSDMAINYFRAVLGIAIQIMTMILIVGIGVSLINDYYTNMQTELDLTEMAVVAVVALTITLLSNRVPQLLSGIITGSAPSGMGIGQFGAGAALGAAGVAAAAATMAGSMIASGATQGAGGISALHAAFSQANANVAAGSDVLANTFGGDQGGGDGGGSGGGPYGGPGGGGVSPGTGAGDTPFAKAAGYSENVTGNDGSPVVAQNDTANNEDGSQGSSEGNRRQDSAGETQTGSSSGSGTVSKAGGVLGAAATASRVGVDAMANLAKGTGQVATEKYNNVMESAKERIADTTGGRIADAIETRSAESITAFSEDSLTSADEIEIDEATEIAAFVGSDSEKA